LSHWPSLSRRDPVHSIPPTTIRSTKQPIDKSNDNAPTGLDRLETEAPTRHGQRRRTRFTVHTLRLCAGAPNLNQRTHSIHSRRDARVEPVRGEGTLVDRGLQESLARSVVRRGTTRAARTIADSSRWSDNERNTVGRAHSGRVAGIFPTVVVPSRRSLRTSRATLTCVADVHLLPGACTVTT